MAAVWRHGVRGGRQAEGGDGSRERLQHAHLRAAHAAPACVRVRDRYVIAEQPAPAPHLAHPEGCAALRIVLVTVPRAGDARRTAG